MRANRGPRTGLAEGGSIVRAIWWPPWSAKRTCCATRVWSNAPGRVPALLAESNTVRARTPYQLLRYTLWLPIAQWTASGVRHGDRTMSPGHRKRGDLEAAERGAVMDPPSLIQVRL
jgi:hypothetical protein